MRYSYRLTPTAPQDPIFPPTNPQTNPPSPSVPDPRPVPVFKKRIRPYKPEDHYWRIGSDLTQVYSSKRNVLVPVEDPEYVAWATPVDENEIVVTSTIKSQTELDDVLDTTGISTRKLSLRADTKRQQFHDKLISATNAQIVTYCQNNFPSLTQPEQNIIAGLMMELAIQAKK